MSSHKRLLTAAFIAFLSLCIVATGIPGLSQVYAAESTSSICTDIHGSNVDANEYEYTRWATPVYSYLTEEGDGYMRVQGYGDSTSNGQNVDVIYYDKNFNATSYKAIKQELPLFGAFAQTQNNYFIISGQENLDEDDDCEVIRVTKYDKSWKRIGSSGLCGADTYIPFDGGSCRVAVVGDLMTIRTCHEMYEKGDGCHHQSNMTIEVNTSTMDMFWGNFAYVSHSFNQFIVASDNEVGVLDHGDAYPRAITITLFESDIENGEMLSYQKSGGGTLERFPGDLGDNDTGVAVGGFEKTSTGYLVAGNSIYQHDEETLDLSRPRNVFVTELDTSEKTFATNWLTDVSDGAGNPQLVKVNDDCFVVLWSRAAYIEYIAVDGCARSISQLHRARGDLSDCKPIVSDGKIIWYVYGENGTDFYEIPVSVTGNGQSATLGQPTVITSDTGHAWTTVSAGSGTAQIKCSRCGKTKTEKYPTHFSMGYSLGNTSYWGYGAADLNITDRIKIFGAYYTNNEYERFTGLKLESSDPENCIVNNNSLTVSFRDTGVYKVTARCKYDTSISDYMFFYVTKPLESVVLTAKPASPQEFGTVIKLTAKKDGGRGNEVFTFTVTEENGSETVLKQSEDNNTTWTPSAPGTYTVNVSVYDTEEPNIVVNDSLVYEVSKKAHPAVMPSKSYNYPFSSSAMISNELLGTAGKAGWEFDDEDIGTVLEPGEEMIFTVHYNKADRNYYITKDMEVTVRHSLCDHNDTELRGAKKATCCAEGATGDLYCLECGELVKESEPIAIDPENHSGLRTIAAKKAGIGVDGYTKKVLCDDCGVVITASKAVPGVTSIYIDTPYNAVYKGSAYYATVSVYAGDKKLTKGVDYKVTYTNNTNAGKATAKVILIGNYEGSTYQTFVISKAANKLAVKGLTATVKRSAVKKKAQYLAVSKVLKFTNVGQGTRSYVKVSGNKKILINKTTGKVTVKKGLKKGTYAVKVKVKATGTSNYKASAWKTVTFKIKVK